MSTETLPMWRKVSAGGLAILETAMIFPGVFGGTLPEEVWETAGGISLAIFALLFIPRIKRKI
jgi:hypothetical protein